MLVAQHAHRLSEAGVFVGYTLAAFSLRDQQFFSQVMRSILM